MRKVCFKNLANQQTRTKTHKKLIYCVIFSPIPRTDGVVSCKWKLSSSTQLGIINDFHMKRTKCSLLVRSPTRKKNGLNWFLSSSETTRVWVLNALLHVINSLQNLNLKAISSHNYSKNEQISSYSNHFPQITSFRARFMLENYWWVCKRETMNILHNVIAEGISLIVSRNCYGELNISFDSVVVEASENHLTMRQVDKSQERRLPVDFKHISHFQ